MGFEVTRVYADEAGETHLAAVGLVAAGGAPGQPKCVKLRDVPTTTLAITEMRERRPTLEAHPPPRRQLLVLLQGAFEVGTSSGERRRFSAGDCLLVDDLDSKGHTFADVGDEPLITVQVGIATDWICPEEVVR